MWNIPVALISLKVSIQLISLASREITLTDIHSLQSEVSIQLISLASREEKRLKQKTSVRECFHSINFSSE